jgi:hypothetical protein
MKPSAVYKFISRRYWLVVTLIYNRYRVLLPDKMPGLPEAAAAVAAMHAAGENLAKLDAAIKAAKFLDAIPGDGRQELRGAQRPACCNAAWHRFVAA